jgi:hypothetical protein
MSNLPDDFTHRDFERTWAEPLNEAANEDMIDYWQERSELFAPPNVIHDRGVE